MREVILRNYQSPGDVVMLTAAVRDLHLSCPGLFRTDVRTACDDLWLHNPYLCDLSADDPNVEVIDCRYPLIDNCDRFPLHFIHGFLAYLNDTLGAAACVHEYKGDIHLSDEERQAPLPFAELAGTPFWLVCAGGKPDFSIKWWEAARYQEVVNHFRGRIRFVQVGESGHHHPALEGAVDLRGRTGLRELIRLVHHAQGVLCGVSLPMHLAAAVEARPGRAPNRACVVVAGGREPPHWEQYPFHQFIHTVGQLKCCSRGGCWRSRTVPLGDGEEHDSPEKVCLDVVDGLPRCMHMITPAMVAERIEGYFAGGAVEYLAESSPTQVAVAAPLCADDAADVPLTEETALERAEAYIKVMPPYPGGFSGRGITICGGGVKYFTGAWVCINMLRKLGCTLPIQIWYLGEHEMSDEMKQLVAPLGVECIDGREVRKQHPVRTLNGWELKPYAILHSPFREVLALDADNVPVKNPEFLFDSAPYLETGAVFWPDYGRLAPERKIWRLCGVEYRDEPEHETGQILVDKGKCWDALCLAMFYNEHSDFFYRFILGDKDSFHMSFRKLGRPYAMPPYPIHGIMGRVMCQHDFDGERLFQHRNLDKWLFGGGNHRLPDFRFEEDCFGFLADLRQRWHGYLPGQNRFAPAGGHSAEVLDAAAHLGETGFIYRRVGYDERPMSFLPDGTVGDGAAGCEMFWNLRHVDHSVVLELSADRDLTARLTRQPNGFWRGEWVVHEKMSVELEPVAARE